MKKMTSASASRTVLLFSASAIFSKRYFSASAGARIWQRNSLNLKTCPFISFFTHLSVKKSDPVTSFHTLLFSSFSFLWISCCWIAICCSRSTTFTLVCQNSKLPSNENLTCISSSLILAFTFEACSW